MIFYYIVKLIATTDDCISLLSDINDLIKWLKD